MSLYETAIRTPVGRLVAKNTPLPQPAKLDRWEKIVHTVRQPEGEVGRSAAGGCAPP